MEIYDLLFDSFGPQHWWPADSPFEVMVGAVLTQNTNWENVEKAIGNLKRMGFLGLQELSSLKSRKLKELIRSVGYYNIKAKRLKNFLEFLKKESDGRLDKINTYDTSLLRDKLLSVSGIGPETADSMLLYALDRPVFVVDAYTKRSLSRHGLIDDDWSYDEIQDLFMNHLKQDVKLFNEYHALLVRLGKLYCKPTPKCRGCPLENF